MFDWRFQRGVSISSGCTSAPEKFLSTAINRVFYNYFMHFLTLSASSTVSFHFHSGSIQHHWQVSYCIDDLSGRNIESECDVSDDEDGSDDGDADVDSKLVEGGGVSDLSLGTGSTLLHGHLLLLSDLCHLTQLSPPLSP